MHERNLYSVTSSSRTYDGLWLNTGVMFILLGALTNILSRYVEANDWVWHGAFCCVGSLLLVLICSRVKLQPVDSLLYNSQFILAISFGINYLLGPSQLYFDNIYIISLRLREYPTDASDALKVDALSCIGFGLQLFASVKFSRTVWLADQLTPLMTAASNVKPGAVIKVLLLVALAAKGVVIVNDFSQDPQAISGLWRTFDKLGLLVIFLAITYRGSRARSYHRLAIIVTGLLSFLGFVGFSKTDLIMPFVVCYLGYGFRVRLNIKKIILVLMFMVYILSSTVGDAIALSREGISKINPSSISERIVLMLEGLSASSGVEIEDRYSIWSRFNYLPSQLAALDFYDIGWGGDDFTLIPWAFVPRLIAPNKPVMTNTGTEFYYKMTGHMGSSTAQGLYANGYYNMGWTGVIIASMVAGWIVGQGGKMSERIVRQKHYLLYPLVFGFTSMASDVIGTLQASFVGAFVIFLYSILVARLMLFLMSSRRKIRSI